MKVWSSLFYHMGHMFTIIFHLRTGIATIHEAEQATGKLINEASRIFSTKQRDPHATLPTESNCQRIRAHAASPSVLPCNLEPSFSDTYDIAWRSDPTWSHVDVLNGLVDCTVTSWMVDLIEETPTARQPPEAEDPADSENSVVCCITSKRQKSISGLKGNLPSPSTFDSDSAHAKLLLSIIRPEGDARMAMMRPMPSVQESSSSSHFGAAC